MNHSLLLSTLASFAISASLAAPAFAQDEEESTTSAEASGSASYSTNDGYRSTARAETTTAAPGGTDHSRFVGTFGIGYLGFRSMAVAAPAGGETTVEAPVVGLRYWLSSGMGIDAGLGFATGGATTTSDVGGMETETEAPEPLVLILHGGLPLALKASQHFVFQVVPELNFGFATNTVEVGMDDADLSGLHFDIGARAGAEIHFGFIDIPELALQAGVGVRLAWDRTKAEVDGDSVTTSRMRFATAVGDNPWNILTANVAALYYF